MSDYHISFIPVNPNYVPDLEIAKQIKNFTVDDAVQKLEINSEVLFADAGGNFENVACPYCKADLQEWWGDAMDSAYSKENGFTNLDIQTPCCHKACSLNDLEYYFPQGFYKTRFSLEPKPQHHINAKDICERLTKVSGIHWRIINAQI